MSSSQSLPAIEVASLYREQHRWLCGWLLRRLDHVGDAADLAHDTFVRLLVAPAAPAASVAPAALAPQPQQALRAPRAYLATIARRLMINHLQRQTLEQAYRDALAALPEASAPSPEQQLLILEALREVNAMLEALPPKVRAVFVLAQIEGLTYAEIAATLNIGLRSVKRYMAQALTECIVLAP